jgi:hypothetical protein
MLAAELSKAGLPAILGPNTLVLLFPAEYNTSSQTCQVPDRLARVESALHQLTGEPWVVKIEADPQSPPVQAGGKMLATTGEARAALRAVRRGSAREEAEKVPLVKYALEKLGASIQRVEEGFGNDAASPAAKEP